MAQQFEKWKKQSQFEFDERTEGKTGGGAEDVYVCVKMYFRGKIKETTM